MAETENSGVMSLTVTLLSAYFANNSVPSTELPELVDGTRRALLGELSAEKPKSVANEDVAVVEDIVPVAPATTPEFKPAVSVEESLASPDQILSLIDGKPYKALKRHLTAHGLTPAEYRLRYGLPEDYPVVAPNYSAARREVARKLGLGGKRKEAADAADDAAVDATEQTGGTASPVVEAPETVIAVAPVAKPAPARRTRAKAASGDKKPTGKKSAVKETKRKAVAVKETVASDTAPPKRKRAAKAAAAAPAPVVIGSETKVAASDAAVSKPKPKKTGKAIAGTSAPVAATAEPETVAAAD